MNMNDSPLAMLELADVSGEDVAARYPGLARVQLLLQQGNDSLFASDDDGEDLIF